MQVYENENYIVVGDPNLKFNMLGSEYLGGYRVLNKLTQISEFQSPSMAEALYNSEQFNQALLTRAWEWRRDKPKPAHQQDFIEDLFPANDDSVN